MDLAASIACPPTARHSLLSSELSNRKRSSSPPSRSCSHVDSFSAPASGKPSFHSSRCSSCTGRRHRPGRRSPLFVPPAAASDGPGRRSPLFVPPAAASDASMPIVASDGSPTYALLPESDDLASSSMASFFASQRLRVLALVAIVMALCNADRVIMSVAIVKFSSMYNWSTSFSGIVQSSFLWGYMLSPIVGGALTDRYGGKAVMAVGAGLWSLATFLTPAAAKQSVWMLFGMRMLMGIAEGVAMPCMNNMVSRWFPRSERARAIGLSMAGFHLGSVIGLLATPVIMSLWGVDMPFITFGLAGAVWLYFWLAFISNDPEGHRFISESELHYIRQNRVVVSKESTRHTINYKQKLLPSSLLLRRLPSWAIIVANFTNNWGYFVLLSWMPIYFSSVFDVNLKQAAWFSALPWTMMAALGCVAGSCSDYLISSGLSVTTVRKIMQSIGFIGPALALIAVNASPSATVAAVWLTAAIGTSSFSQAGFLLNFQEIAPRQAGVLQGVSNTVGTMGAIISTIGIGYFIQWLGSFQAFLMLTAAIYAAATIFWNFCAAGERVFE